MIISDKPTKTTGFITAILKVLKSLPSPIFKSIPVKFPLKYFLITVLSTIIIWSILVSAIIYRNAYKPDISKLADILHFSGRREKHRTVKAIKAFLFAPFNWMSANLNGEEIPHIYIDIKFKNYLKLVKKREEALVSGALLRTPNDYIPVKITLNRSPYNAKLRLKGDEFDHWGGDKWSFRVNMKDNNHLFGMRRFSLQSPSRRNFEGEIIFFEALRREGILTPRYFFVDLTINGKYIGIMACQEHFSKELLESKGRRESVILKFDEDNMSTINEGGPVGKVAAFNSFRTNFIEPFRPNKILKSKELSNDLKIATGLLRGFANGNLSTAQVFDVELMGAYMAVAAAWGAEHPIRWRNARFYYNPITGLLEPIGYDATLFYFKRRYFDITANHDMIGSDIMESGHEIKPIYESVLRKLKQEAEDGTMEGWVIPLQKQSHKILHKEYPLLGGISLFGMARGIQENLDRSRDLFSRYRTVLEAHLIEDETGSYVELVNPLPHHMIISNIELITGEKGGRRKLETVPPLNFPFRLLRTPLQNVPTSIKLYYKKTHKNKIHKVLISAHIAGDDKNWEIQAFPYFSPKTKEAIPTTTLHQALRNHPYLIQGPDLNSLRIKQGNWIIEKSLVIPKGFSLTISENTTLQFSSNSALILKGPLIIQGTKKNPVLLTGVKDPVHSNKSWPGVVVQKTKGASQWSHVVIRNTAGVSNKGWSLSGGVNFYEAAIQMKNVSIVGSRAEDALNIVRSDFELDFISIKDTASDGLDSDFSEGTVQTGTFENIGESGEGDGIDISGSKVIIKNVFFKNISDKALSVGENSRMVATHVSMERVGTAAVSKDGSFLSLADVKIKSAHIAGLMAYLKKSEYGPGTIVAKNVEVKSAPKVAVVQKGSFISIDGSNIEETDLNVKDLYAAQKKSGIKN